MATALPQPADDGDLDTDLGERYYKGSRTLEEQCMNEIVELIREGIDRHFREGRRPARRDAHAFDTGCVRAYFRVDPDLNPELQHGAFVPGREYEAWLRFSNGNVVARPRRFPDARGMAIKLMGVDGPKLLDDEKYTQDFVLISHPVFFVDDLERYKATLKPFLRGGYIDQYLLSPLQLNFREMILAFKVNLLMIGNPLFRQYWSMTPYRLGVEPGRKTAVKYTAKPRLARKPSLKSRLSAYFAWDFSLKNEMHRTLAGNEVWFDFYIQRHVDERTPIEDSTVEWDENLSPPEHVAKIIIPLQELISADRDWFCENLSFNPWHSLAEHRPLGLVNRVRRNAYLEISKYRHALNQVPLHEPKAGDPGP